MKEWILAVSSVCLISTVLELFLSEGTTKKYVVGFLRIGLILLMLMPLVRLIKNSDELSSVFQAEEVSMEGTTIQTDFFRTLAEKNLNDSGVECTIRLTENEKGEIEFVDIYLQESVISEKDRNINKKSKTVIDTIKTYLDVSEEKIRVWGK